MYNLFVTANKDSWNGDPFVIEKERCINRGEYTDENIADEFKELNLENIEKIKKLPCIFAYESQCNKSPKFGYIEEISTRENGNKIRIRYKILNLNKFLSFSELHSMSIDFDIANYEMNRTHWAIKNVDIYKKLTNKGINIADSKSNNSGEEKIKIENSIIHGDVVGHDKKTKSIGEEKNKLFKLEIIIPIIIAMISIPWWPTWYNKIVSKNDNQIITEHTEAQRPENISTSTIDVLSIFNKLSTLPTTLEKSQLIDEYLGAKIYGQGVFSDIDEGGDKYFVLLKVSNNSIVCFFDKKYEKQLLLFRKGDEILFTGEFTNGNWAGTNSRVIENCEIKP